MTRRYFNLKSNNRSATQGVVIPLMAFFIVVVLIVGGLAVDAGNLYRSNIILQNAADAGALASMASTYLESGFDHSGKWQTPSADDVVNRAEEVVQDNLVAAGFSLKRSKISVVPQFDGKALLGVEVKVGADIDSLLIKHVPFEALGLGSPDTPVVSSVAASARKAANVALILDYSGSMNCSTDQPEDSSTPYCNCLRKTRLAGQSCEMEAGSASQKFEDLESAVDNFIEFFDEDRDRVSLVTFNTVAKLWQHVNTEKGFVKKDIREALKQARLKLWDDSSPVAAGTNVSDGLITAYQDMWDHKIVGNEEIHYVLFSDGTPTAARFLLASDTGIEKHSYIEINDGKTAPGKRDYIHYTLQWVQPEDESGTPGEDYPGPSWFLKKSFLLDLSTPSGFPDTHAINFPIESFVKTPPEFPPASAPSLPVDVASSYGYSNPPKLGDYLPDCMTHDSNGDGSRDQALTPPSNEHSESDVMFQGFFASCLKDNGGTPTHLGFHMPNEPDVEGFKSFGSDYKVSKPSADSSDKWVADPSIWPQQYANVALQTANFLRSKKGTMWVVGFGSDPCDFRKTCNRSAAGHNCCPAKDDPYLDTADVHRRKDVFLTRMANNCKQVEDGEYPEFSFSNYEPCDSSSPRQTEYLKAISSDQLKGLFKTIAQDILLQLTK